MTNNENFENIKSNLLGYYQSQLKQFKESKEQLLESQKSDDIRKIDFYSKRINSILDNINIVKSRLACMRLNNEDDLKERNNIMTKFPELVNEIIPNDIPIVFHGNNKIEIVKQIISSGGLYTPYERELTFQSSETPIYVTYKSNIRASCKFADSSINAFMPYGAMFVFYPKEHEYEKVLETGESYEVEGGVESVNFSEDRFVGIITTTENLAELKRCFDENKLDSNKVFTHQQFLDYCKDEFIFETKKLNINVN